MASPLRNLGAGLLRGTTADVLGMPIDTLNMIRQGLLSPAQGGNPYARSIAGLLGPTQEVGSSDYFAQQMGLPQGEGLLYEGARMVSPSPTDLMSLARRAPIQELITYHGTPHRFEPTPANPLGEFEAAKIGSGEGAQAYGHGLYLAEDPSVAKTYRAIDGPVGQSSTQVDLVNLAMNKSSWDRESARKMLNEWANETKDQYSKRQLYDAVNNIDDILDNPPGSLYTADLPDEMIDRMLDWNKPLSEQPESVRKALRQAGLYDSKNERNRRNAVARLDEISSEMDALAKDRLMPSNRIKDESNGKLARERDALVEKSVNVTGEDACFMPQESVLALIKGRKSIKQTCPSNSANSASPASTCNFVVFPGEEKKVKILKRD
jgi:hypothetical protein